MAIVHVVVEAWDAEGNGDYFECVVLAFSERGARQAATRAMTRLGYTGAHSVEATQLDHTETGTILITKRAVPRGLLLDPLPQPVFKKEATLGY